MVERTSLEEAILTVVVPPSGVAMRTILVLCLVSTEVVGGLSPVRATVVAEAAVVTTALQFLLLCPAMPLLALLSHLDYLLRLAQHLRVVVDGNPQTVVSRVKEVMAELVTTSTATTGTTEAVLVVAPIALALVAVALVLVRATTVTATLLTIARLGRACMAV